MSDESFRASQSAHAQEQKAIHILVKTFGCTRSQARESVRKATAQRDLNAHPNPNAGSKASPLFQPAPQRSEVKVETVRTAVRVAVPDQLVIPALPATIETADGDWTTVFICTDGGSTLVQVLSRPYVP